MSCWRATKFLTNTLSQKKLSLGDGLQILRYNVSTAYNSHLDYIEDKSGQLEHDFDSSGTGGNRFATILMYMSDLEPEDGGETVFPKAWPPQLPVEERVSTKTVSFIVHSEMSMRYYT